MNDSETATSLLREARRLFADRGYRGASIRAITQAANANLGAVTYHFGSKDALYRAVLETVFGEMADRVERAARTPAPAVDRLRSVVHALFTFFLEAPDAPGLILHQLVAGEGIPEPVLPYLRRNLGAIRGAAADGMAAGEIRALDPTLVAFTIISQVVWFAIVGRELATLLGGPTDHPRFAAQIEQHVSDVVTRFVTDGGALS
jgi:AcrR family transcriptional regulator